MWGCITVTMFMLVKAFRIMIHTLRLDQALYCLHSPRRGGPTSSYRAPLDLLEVKWYGIWATDVFWAYITSPCTSTSSVAAATSNTC